MNYGRSQRTSLLPRACMLVAGIFAVSICLPTKEAVAGDPRYFIGGIAGGIAAGIIASQMMRPQRPGVVYYAPRKRHVSRARSAGQEGAAASADKQAARDPFAGVTPTIDTRVRGPNR